MKNTPDPSEDDYSSGSSKTTRRKRAPKIKKETTSRSKKQKRENNSSVPTTVSFASTSSQHQPTLLQTTPVRPAVIGVARSISACHRCRLRKTRCDQKFPSCNACLKAGVECVGIDAATGRQIPRSYVSHLEDRVAMLELKIQELTNGAGTPGSDIMNISHPSDNTTSATNSTSSTSSTTVTDSNSISNILASTVDPSIPNSSSSLSNSDLPNRVSNKSSISTILNSPNISAYHDTSHLPSDSHTLSLLSTSSSDAQSKYTNNHISNNITPNNNSPASSVNGFQNGPQISPAKDNDEDSTGVEGIMSTVKMVSSKAATSAPSAFLGSSSGLSFARLLLTAIKFNNANSNDNSSSTHHATAATSSSSSSSSQLKPGAHKVKPAHLPSKETAEKFLYLFFSQANSQLPVIHREQFLTNHFIPIYGPLSEGTSLASDYTTIGVPLTPSPAPSPAAPKMSPLLKHTSINSNSSNGNSSIASPKASTYVGSNTPIAISNYNAPEVTESTPKKALYFLNLMFAIATSIHHQTHPAHISESFRVAAMQHLDSVLSSPNRLEALQGILLLAQYSIMRPAVPGIWYVLGWALRLCVDLGLHTEAGIKSSLSVKTPGSQPMYDPYTLDMRRRLFWCTYAIDRQVCVYLGRPFGIPEESIKVPFPSQLDDTLISEDDYSDLNDIQSDLSRKAPSYKIISVSFFRIRKIQAEIQRILYDCAALPREYNTIEEWRTAMGQRLEAWHSSCPKSAKKMNCNFNLAFIELNYHQTRLLLYGPTPSDSPEPSEDNIATIADAGEKVIQHYQNLHRHRSINYTWVAVHNLFMAGTSYLYALYHSPVLRSETTLEEIEYNAHACIEVLSALVDRCDAAVSCRATFELLTAAILKLCTQEKVAAAPSVPNTTGSGFSSSSTSLPLPSSSLPSPSNSSFSLPSSSSSSTSRSSGVNSGGAFASAESTSNEGRFQGSSPLYPQVVNSRGYTGISSTVLQQQQRSPQTRSPSISQNSTLVSQYPSLMQRSMPPPPLPQQLQQSPSSSTSASSPSLPSLRQQPSNQLNNNVNNTSGSSSGNSSYTSAFADELWMDNFDLDQFFLEAGLPMMMLPNDQLGNATTTQTGQSIQDQQQQQNSQGFPQSQFNMQQQQSRSRQNSYLGFFPSGTSPSQGSNHNNTNTTASTPQTQQDSSNISSLPQQQPQLSTGRNNSLSSNINNSGTPQQQQLNTTYFDSSEIFGTSTNSNASMGPRIFDIINEVPMAAIWDQYFAPSSVGETMMMNPHGGDW